MILVCVNPLTLRLEVGWFVDIQQCSYNCIDYYIKLDDNRLLQTICTGLGREKKPA
jgi:hypothetical protein